MTTRKKHQDVFEALLVSDNLFGDLCDVFPDEFYTGFAQMFDGTPSGPELFKVVHVTARAYLIGKHEKQAAQKPFLEHTGRHLFETGLAAHRLAYSLRQVGKSEFAASSVAEKMAQHTGQTRLRGNAARSRASTKNGPQRPLQYLQELVEALEGAMDDLVGVPARQDNEGDFRKKALARVEVLDDARLAAKAAQSKHHALECAALAFRPFWTAHSQVKYQRGRYHHDRGGYDSPPARALHRIIANLDKTVALSLTETAIENIRTQP